MHQKHDTVSRRSVLQLGIAGAAATGLVAAGVGGGTAAASEAPAAATATLPRRYLRLLDRTTTPDSWVAEPFTLADVSLAPSVATRSQDQMLNFLRVYPVDRVLAVFRRNAGLDTKGAQAPGSWEGFGAATEEAWGPAPDYPYPGTTTTRPKTANLLRGHWGGHFLSAVSLAYASTGEQVFKDKADQIVAGLAEVQAALAASGRYSHPGFLAAYGEWQYSELERYTTYGTIWAPYYTAHKIMAGLRDAYQLADVDAALPILVGMGDWVGSRLDHLPDDQLQKMWGIYIAGEYGGMNEVLADLTAITGDPKYQYTATRFTITKLVDACATGVDILNGKHANQHIPQFSGYTKMYDLTGDTHYLDAVKGFFGQVVPGRTFAHGGHGKGEYFGPAFTVGGNIGPRNAETCGTYNMLKIARLMYFHTLDAQYMEFYEKALTNHIIGSRLNTESATSPQVTYMYPVNPGTTREYGNTGTCCGGTGMENHVKYRDSIYFKSSDGSTLYVNLYLASTLDWAEKGFQVVQETEYPRVGSTKLTINGSGQLNLQLRVPSWTRKGYAVKINGKKQNLVATPGKYVSIDRVWASGDVVEVSMPLGIRAVPTIDDPTIWSIEWGPTVLLARGSETDYISLSLYANMGLDGTLDSAFTDAGKGYFTLGNRTFEPAWSGDNTAYHMYVKRSEPTIVFAGVDTGIANVVRDDRTSFLDHVWADGGFANHGGFVSKVDHTVAQFVADGLLSEADGERVITAAAQSRIS